MKGRLEILDAIYFQAGKDEIRPSSFPLVDAIAATLNGNPQLALVEVQGHTARGEKDRLATNRANAVVKALGERNVDRTRLVARAYGNAKPICTQRTEDCLSRNRRVTFVILNRDDRTELSERVPRPWNKPTPPSLPPPPPRVAPVPDQERRFAEATALLRAGKPQQARSAAQAWRDQRPADVLALLALGAAAEATGDLPLAARAYGSLIDLFPAQADDRRLAGERLERLGGDALALAVDTFRQARAQRPDQPSSHRLLAYALVRAGQPAAALDVALEGIRQGYAANRFAGIGLIMREDAGIIAAAAIRQNPGTRENVMRRLSDAGVGLATGRSLRFVLSWETDASDVDLHVKDGKGGIAWYSRPNLDSGGRLYAGCDHGLRTRVLRDRRRPRGLPLRALGHLLQPGPDRLRPRPSPGHRARRLRPAPIRRSPLRAAREPGPAGSGHRPRAAARELSRPRAAVRASGADPRGALALKVLPHIGSGNRLTP